jgi:hypothetical protein
MLADASKFSSFVSSDAADSLFDRCGTAGTGFASFCDGGVEVCCAELAPSPCCCVNTAIVRYSK